MLVYLVLYFSLPPIVDEEVREEVTNNLKPWEVVEGESFIKAMLTRPFDLNITEEGQYRPRYLGFLVQFLDENIFLRVTRRFPSFGNRQPFYILSMFCTVLSIFYFIRSICKKIPKGLAWLLSTIPILFQNYQVATYWRARSAKLLAISACIFIITYAIKLIDEKITKKNVYKLIYAFPIFLLMTLDEQVLAIAVMACSLLLLFCLINRKINLGACIYSIATFLYLTFYLWWGKSLFLHFTGSLTKHGHTIEGAVKGLSFNTIKEGIKIIVSETPKIMFMSFTIFAILWVIYFIRMLVSSKSKKEKIINIIISNFIVVSSLALMTLMIDAHSAIYELPCLWKSIYPLISILLMYISFIYLTSNSEEKNTGIRNLIIVIGVIISLVYNILNINNYYGAYFVEKGGFRDDFTDLIVTDNNIEINVYKASEMDIDNFDIISTLNTYFATNNGKTSKIIKGKINEEFKIEEKFSCYLLAQKERKLHFSVSIEEYKKYESLSIIINKNEILNLPITSKDVEGELMMKTEINRAAYVELRLNRKAEYLDSNNNLNSLIKLNELYTY